LYIIQLGSSPNQIISQVDWGVLQKGDRFFPPAHALPSARFPIPRQPSPSTTNNNQKKEKSQTEK